MKNTWIWVAVVIVVVVAGSVWWFSAQTPGVTNAAPTAVDTGAASAAPGAGTSTATDAASAGASAPMSATITYDGSSFSPSTITIKLGGTVTWNGPSTMWIASNPHPQHTGYDGTSLMQHCAAGYSGAAPFDECTNAGSFTFTFDKVGTWGYHDHANHGATGTVVVVE